MKKVFLVLKAYIRKTAIAMVLMFAMVLSLVSLTSCDMGLFSADVEETTRSNVSQVIQNEPIVLAENQAKANSPYGMKDENGIARSVLSSGDVVSQVIGGITNFETCYEVKGNVFITKSDIYDKTTFDNYNLFILSDVEVDYEFMSNNSHINQAWEEFLNRNDFDTIVCAGKTQVDISCYVEEIFVHQYQEELENGYLADLFFTDYMWYEIDLTAPTIGGSVHASVNVDNQPSIDEIVSHVYALDETDGYVPVLVESSTYVQGTMEVGDYTINIYALDKSSNRNNEIIYVHRYDYTAPIISGTDSYDLNYDNDLTLSQIESALTISDNVDSGLKLEKVSDTFTGNEHKLGNYQVVYRTKDRSNNMSANKTINIAVKNKGTSVIGGTRVIEVGTNQVLTLEEFKSHVSVVDGYDGVITNYTIEGFDDYTATSKVVGTNIIKVSHTNSGNNLASAEFSIVKKDKLVPGFLFDDYFIQLKQGEVFTLDMIMNQAALILNLDIAQIESVSGEYDVMTLGNYGIDICLTTGEKKAFTLSVVDEYGKNPSDKIVTKDFFSAEGYVNNLFKPNNWNVYHYLTILGIVLVVSVGIALGVGHHRKKQQNQYDMYR